VGSDAYVNFLPKKNSMFRLRLKCRIFIITLAETSSGARKLVKYTSIPDGPR
jgi:hypothetical protein